MMAMLPGSNMQHNYVNMQLIYVMFMLVCQMNRSPAKYVDIITLYVNMT